jgi:DNA-binding IclR family transcriptional regulator
VATIQSIERAAAVLHLLGAVHEPVPLGELARLLDLPKPTVHGIVRTLCEVGFAAQEPDTGRYTIGAGLTTLTAGVDPHLLRSRAVNWAGGLAARTGMEVELGVMAGQAVELVHHVFRPDGSPQRLRVGEIQPIGAGALGLVLVAFSPASASGVVRGTSDLGPGPASKVSLTRAVQLARRQGWAWADSTLRPGVATLAAPLRRHLGQHLGVGVGALGISGPRDRVIGPTGEPREDLVAQVVAAARAVSSTLQERL